MDTHINIGSSVAYKKNTIFVKLRYPLIHLEILIESKSLFSARHKKSNYLKI